MSLPRDLKLIRLIKDASELNQKKRIFSNDIVVYLLKALENADRQLSADIENDLVMLGERAVNPLVKALSSSNEKVRGCAAMALIRIDNGVEKSLKLARTKKPDLAWVIDFIISQISGKKIIPVKNNHVKAIAS